MTLINSRFLSKLINFLISDHLQLTLEAFQMNLLKISWIEYKQLRPAQYIYTKMSIIYNTITFYW